MTSGTTRIITATRRDETIIRAGGNGDNWHMTWAADGAQLTALCDGTGLPGIPLDARNSRLCRVIGDPPDITFADVPGYPLLVDGIPAPGFAGRTRYYGFGTIAVDGVVYQYLSTWNKPLVREVADLRFVGAKLIYSPDGGTSWRNQDGTLPVRWEPWGDRSKETMVFFEESQDAFSLVSILQMGRDYSRNVDGFIYGYAPNGNTDGSMNELVMFRVPKHRVLDRSAYEFFRSRRPDGTATWTPDIDERGVVLRFPLGSVNKLVHPYAWQPSVTYNESLGLYLLATWGDGTAPDGTWFGRPSYLGMWASAQPWGPWEQFHEETSWTPAGDAAARCYQPQIAPRWIAPDGRSLWLVWTDFQESAAVPDIGRRLEELQGILSIDSYHELRRTVSPYYAFNLQRVDLVVA